MTNASDSVARLGGASLPVPDWKLPPGVSRSVWEFSHDREIARNEDQHLAGAPLLDFDRQIMRQWFPDPCRLADLGCGTGRTLVEFASRGCQCTGIDLSEESLTVAAERLSARGLSATLLRANLCDLSCLAGGAFDGALLLFGTLGMISGPDNRREAVAQAGRLLRPGGRFALHVHNVWRHLFSPTGRRWLARDLVKRLLADPTAGDTERDYRGIPRMYHHAFSLREVRHLLSDCSLTLRELIPLAPLSELPQGESGSHRSADGVPEMICRGWLSDLRATGWLILAEK